MPAVTLPTTSKAASDRRVRPNGNGPHSRSVPLSLKLTQQVQETKRAIERSIGKLFGVRQPSRVASR